MKRATTTYERTVYYHGTIGQMFYAFYLKINKSINLNEFKNALKKIRKKHPITGIRVDMTENKKQYITTDNVPEFPITIYNSAETTWPEIVKNDLKKSFNIYKGPLIRFFIIEHNDYSEIITVFHHGICDGVSAVIFLHDLFNFLSNSSLVQKANDFPLTLTEAVKDNIKQEIFNRPLPDWINERNDKNIDEEIRNKKIIYPDPDFNLVYWSMEKDELQNLLEYTRFNKISINSIIASAFLKSFSKEFGESDGYNRTVMCPVNFKIYFKEEAKSSMGLFNGLIKSQINCTPERTLIEMASDIKKDIKDKLNSYIPLDGYLYYNKEYLKDVDDPELLFKKYNTDSPMDYDFSLSNLGRIELNKNYGEYKIEEIHGPIFSAIRGERVIGVLTHGNKIYFNFIYDKKCFNEEAANRIIKNTQNILSQIADKKPIMN